MVDGRSVVPFDDEAAETWKAAQPICARCGHRDFEHAAETPELGTACGLCSCERFRPTPPD